MSIKAKGKGKGVFIVDIDTEVSSKTSHFLPWYRNSLGFNSIIMNALLKSIVDIYIFIIMVNV